MTNILSRKQAIREFEELDPKVAAQIKSVRDHPEMLAAIEKLQNLRDQLKEVEEKIRLHYEGPAEGGIQSASPEEDAIKIIEGLEAKDLPGQSQDTMRENLHRQRMGLIKAIEIKQVDIQLLNIRLVTEGCREYENIAKKFIKSTIEAFEAVEKALKRQEVFFNFFSIRGYEEAKRPAHFRTSPFEISTLYGGISSLAWYLEKRKVEWGFKTKSKGKSHKIV